MGIFLWSFVSLVLLAVLSYILSALFGKKLVLENQHVLITGGSEGLGLAFAKLVASKGARVSIVSRNEEKLVKAAKEIGEVAKRPVKWAVVDVRDSKQVEEAFADCVRQQSEKESKECAIDILVSNAGLSLPNYFLDITEDEAKLQMDVNYFGAVNSTRAVLPSFQKRKKGRIAYVSSACALDSFTGYSAYAASKWAVRGFCQSLRSELSIYGVDLHIFYAPTMTTPGYEKENVNKPLPTAELEALSDENTAEQAAEILYKGMCNNNFSIAGGDPGIVMMSIGALSSPSSNIFLRVLLAPVIALVFPLWRVYTMYVTKKHNGAKKKKGEGKE